jgi:ABC-2 type transport system ATP-binding protein
LSRWNLSLNSDGQELEYTFDASVEHRAVPALLQALHEAGIGFVDLNTRQSSLEEIFVDLVSERGAA